MRMISEEVLGNNLDQDGNEGGGGAEKDGKYFTYIN
jgi:hypothetical protein